MVETIVFMLLLVWVASTLVMSVTAGAIARRTQRKEERLRRELLMARMREAQPADSLVRSRS